MLDLLGYDAKWVVDWADHVWCEVLVGGEWVHVDPCEASVNEPLIYEGWGKNQTYILSYSSTDVDDVTAKYTTRFNETLLRRKDDYVNSTFIEERLEQVRRELREDATLPRN
jgi:peptide-N4-(N-acetyl-beta-glucosaminyl)asparagine amidase